MIPKKLKVFNLMEALVSEVVEEMFLMPNLDMCTCNRCKLDTLIMVLNKFPPKYSVTLKGKVFTELETLKTQYRADILRETLNAMEIVKNNPSHSYKKPAEKLTEDIDDFLDEIEQLINTNLNKR
ncbi:hypothetical protein OSSY52_08140 [Tepiditoga spiralis]|uniref:Uncharacterized protein n=1 Tax=Tepiditoga spiralis TaxID=2108365 RepID=A0A7G1G726_9BACT|nr:late competence development ComFB family protein [Tepiditoga spiralis]BBE30673.1 hypothetical protein OSSY52_08140 [Tepiditoga spiralis]